jgi:hypothetical protein
VTLDREMQLGHALTVTVSNVEDAVTGKVIDPVANFANFASGGVRPRVVSAAQSSGRVQIQFDESLLNDADLQNPANYVFAGPSVVTPTAAVIRSPIGQPANSAVRVTINRLLNGGAYSVTASLVKDTAGNVLDPAHAAANFVGFATPLTVITPGTLHSALEVDVEFSDPVRQVNAANSDDALNPGNYAVGEETPGGIVILPHTISHVTSLTSSLVRVEVSYTTPLPPATSLVIVVNNVKDIPGNTLNPLAAFARFISLGVGSPLIRIYPPDGYKDMAVDQPVEIHLVDVDPAATGIDMSTLIVDVSASSLEGRVIDAGITQPGWRVETSGAPLDFVNGVRVKLRPSISGNNWLEKTAYTFGVFVADIGAAMNYARATITTGVPVYIEDQLDLGELTPLERKLIYGVKTQLAEEIRKIAIRACTLSTDSKVAARTLITMACETGLAPLFRTQVPAALVDSKIKLRRPPTTFVNALAWVTDVRPVFRGDPTTDVRTIDLLSKRQLSGDSVLVSSALAATLIAIALSELHRHV